jgi:two-component system, cell cycle sensor histidine kinase and response regulator CckA
MSSVAGLIDAGDRSVEALLAGQNRILEMIATNAPLEDTLASLVLLIESRFEGMLCSVLLLDDDGQHMRHGAAPSLPDPYRRAVDGLMIGPKVGSCGTAMFRGEPVIVTDILEDPLWEDYRALASRHGLRACWSTPIASPQGKVLGSFAMYYREPRSPGSAEIQLTNMATRLAGIAIERWQTDLERRRASENYRALVENLNDAVFSLDAEGRFSYVSPIIENLSGYPVDEVLGKPFSLFAHPEDLPALQNSFLNTVAGHQMPFEFRVIDKSGGIHWWRSSSRRILAGDRVIGVTGILQDITRFKHAQARLEESEKRFRAVYERAPVGMAVVDSASGRFLWANPRYCEITGRTEKEMLQTDFQSITHPDDLIATQRRAQTLTSGEIQHVEVEKRYVRPDGSAVWVHVSAAPMGSLQDQPRCNLVMVQDVTESKETREALRRSELNYRMFVAQSSEGIFRLDMDTPVAIGLPEDELTHLILHHSYMAECNDALARMYGFASSRDLTGMRLTEILVMTDARNIELTRDFIRSGFDVRDRESHEVDRQGNPKVFLNSMTGIVEKGKLARTWGIQRDITEWVRLDEARQDTEEALRNAELNYRTIFEQAVIGIFQSTPGGKCLSANPAIAVMFGYESLEEFMARANNGLHQFYVDPECRAQLVRVMERNDNVRDFEFQAYRKNGSIMWLSLSARAIRKGGVIVRYDGMAQDITERKGLEKQLLQAQKMEAVGRLAGGISHDFNNVLGVILGQGEMLLKKLEPSDERRRVEQICQAGKRAAALTGQLLAFSRQQILQPTTLDINGVIENFSSMLTRLIGEDITLVASLDPELGRISADAGQIEQVLMNLVVNARDAMPQGGTIDIRTFNMELDDAFVRQHAGTKPGHAVVLMVSDTGTGIDEPTAARLFEPFFTTKEPGKGTGLGLATVYGIVKQSGGYISVDSDPGKGTSFSIYLPRVQEAGNAESLEKSSSQPAYGSETILLVEDAAPLREVTREFLKEAGYAVLEAGDASEALETAGRYTAEISLLITDVVLPGINGHALAERLISQRPGTKVLYISGYTDDAMVRHGVLQSELAFLKKPFTQDALTHKVREILDAAA